MRRVDRLPWPAREIADRVRSAAEPVATRQGVRLVEVNVKTTRRGPVIECVIDRRGGVSIEACESFSNELSPLLDIMDPLPGPYTLEVCSAGLDRTLHDRADFELHLGENVDVQGTDSAGVPKAWRGVIAEVGDDTLSVDTGNGTASIPWEQIRHAKLVIDVKNHEGQKSRRPDVR